MTVPYAAATADHELLEWLGGGMMQVLLDGERTGGQLAMFRSSAPAGAASPAHLHIREDEIVVLLRGSGIFWVGDRRYELGEGGVAFLPRGVPHAYRITADAETLNISTPGGLETFFRTAGRDVREPRPDGWQVSFDVLAQASEAAGQTILAAPLEADEMIPEAVLGR
jgi:quercetin dioxygenase-like cupin family protein